MSVKDRFSNRMSILRSAINCEVELDKEYPTLFQALCRFYADKRRVQFWGIDVEEDYEILIDNLNYDLTYG